MHNAMGHAQGAKPVAASATKTTRYRRYGRPAPVYAEPDNDRHEELR